MNQNQVSDSFQSIPISYNTISPAYKSKSVKHEASEISLSHQSINTCLMPNLNKQQITAVALSSQDHNSLH